MPFLQRDDGFYEVKCDRCGMLIEVQDDYGETVEHYCEGDCCPECSEIRCYDCAVKNPIVEVKHPRTGKTLFMCQECRIKRFGKPTKQLSLESYPTNQLSLESYFCE